MANTRQLFVLAHTRSGSFLEKVITTNSYRQIDHILMIMMMIYDDDENYVDGDDDDVDVDVDGDDDVGDWLTGGAL